jgi:hypothetical protein
MKSKKIFIVFFIVASFFSSCIQYTQLFQTVATSKMEKEKDYYAFENDTLKIVYDFWAERGILFFSIYNKLDIPIYLDWKKCSFIKNGDKYDYWIDEEVTNSQNYYSSYGTSKQFFKPRIYIATDGGVVAYGTKGTVNISTGMSVGTSVKTKAERVIFIAPKSAIYEAKFYLVEKGGILLRTDKPTITENRNDKPSKKTSIYVADYGNSSQLTFRNFLTFSTTEKFEKEFYIDNGFCISKILEMDRRHFNGKIISWNQTPPHNYSFPFSDPTSFYINIEDVTSIKFRSK